MRLREALRREERRTGHRMYAFTKTSRLGCSKGVKNGRLRVTQVGTLEYRTKSGGTIVVLPF